MSLSQAVSGNLLRATRRYVAQAFACIAIAHASVAAAGVVDVVEFYNASLDHYFVTANADEIGKLDTGFFVGWQRTGQSFKAFDATDTSPGALPVCRFYGMPSAGLDSHFYSASSTECNEVKQKFPLAWQFESGNVFGIYLPDLGTGQCPANSVAVYRSWNKRTDSNHRYTTSTATQDAMLAKGYVAEGYGPGSRPVAMCSPTPAPALPPACSLSASSTTANVGTSVQLTASCTNTPTSYSWTGCGSTGPTCTASSATAATVNYTVVAANGNGPSVPATIGVTWVSTAPPPPPENAPVCGLIVTSQESPPVVGSLVVLESSCSGTPTGYVWTNCVSSTNVCVVRGSTTGLQTYSVAGSNSGGTGVAATANVNWVGSSPPPAGLCGFFPTTLYSEVGSTNGTAHSLYSDSPAFAWNGAWAVRFNVPATANSSQAGFAAVAEYGAPATYRETTISTQACDFRATDITGAAGPIARGNSNTAFITFGIGTSTAGHPALTPGGTYYLNVRNYYPTDGSITCPATPGRCDASALVSVPR